VIGPPPADGNIRLPLRERRCGRVFIDENDFVGRWCAGKLDCPSGPPLVANNVRAAHASLIAEGLRIRRQAFPWGLLLHVQVLVKVARSSSGLLRSRFFFITDWRLGWR